MTIKEQEEKTSVSPVTKLGDINWEAPSHPETFYRDIYNAVNDPIVIFDIKGETVIDFNTKVSEQYGFTLEDMGLINMQNQAIGSPFGIEEVRQYNHRAAEGKPQIIEWPIRHKDGRAQWAEINLKCSTIGGIERLVAIVRDISVRKQLEEKLQKAKEDAETANRAKDVFLANMSHELKSPLNGILGMAELLMCTQLNDEQINFVKIIHQSADLLTGIINDILDLSRMDLGKIRLEEEIFELRSVIDITAQLVDVKAKEKGIILKTFVDPQIPVFLKGDPKRLCQILLNLTSNAIKFTEQGEVTQQVIVSAADNERVMVHFEVTDNGIGLPEESLQKIFEPFVQGDSSTARKYGGTGLGLTITKHLVELMGGDICVESEVGKGSSFRFTVPLQLPATNNSENTIISPGHGYCPKTASPSNIPTKTANLKELSNKQNNNAVLKSPVKILIVDDDSIILDYLSLGLGHEGYSSIQIASTGRDALNSVMAKPPDVVILDWMLQDILGPEMCLRLRTLANPLILMLTAKNAVNDRVTCLRAGADDYLVKPFHFSEFLARLEALLRRRDLPSGREYFHYLDLTLWPTRRVAYREQRLLQLTPTEFNLLHLLLRHQNQVLSKEIILQQVWGYDFNGDYNIVETYIGYLRRKLGNPMVIHTVRGVGYFLGQTDY